MAKSIAILVLIAIFEVTAADDPLCSFNDDNNCTCVQGSGQNDFAQVSCLNVEKFPTFKPSGEVTIGKLVISGEFKEMPQSGLDVFKHINHAVIERKNRVGTIDIQGEGKYLLANCSLGGLTVIGFGNVFPLTDVLDLGTGLRLDPGTLARLSELGLEESDLT